MNAFTKPKKGRYILPFTIFKLKVQYSYGLFQLKIKLGAGRGSTQSHYFAHQRSCAKYARADPFRRDGFREDVYRGECHSIGAETDTHHCTQ